MKSLKTLGYLVYPDPQCDGGYGESQSLRNRGVDVRGGNLNGVLDVGIYEKGVRTVDRAQVDMTLAQLKEIYGLRLSLEEKYDQPGGVQIQTAVVADGGNELLFTFDVDEGATLKDSDAITMMVARERTSDLTYDGC